MSDSEGLGSKILNIDRRIIATIGLVALIYPLIFPIGLPLNINKYTKMTYDVMDALPEGSVVIFESSFDTGYYGSIGPSFTAIMQHAMLKNLKMIIYALHIEGPIVYDTAFNDIPKSVRDTYVYGEDYVFLGFMTGGESAQLTAAEDLRRLYSYDNYGTPLDDLPLLDGINSYEDYDMIVAAFRGGEYGGHTMRIWAETFNMPLIRCGQMATVPVQLFDAGLLVGFLRGTRGAAEYELLLNSPGAALSMLDAMSLFFSYLILTVILGNIGFFLRKQEYARKQETIEQ